MIGKGSLPVCVCLEKKKLTKKFIGIIMGEVKYERKRGNQKTMTKNRNINSKINSAFSVSRVTSTYLN